MKSPLYEISNDGKILTLTSGYGKVVELTIEAVSIEVITWSDDVTFDIDVLNLPNVMGEVTVEGMRDHNKRIGSIITGRDLIPVINITTNDEIELLIKKLFKLDVVTVNDIANFIKQGKVNIVSSDSNPVMDKLINSLTNDRIKFGKYVFSEELQNRYTLDRVCEVVSNESASSPVMVDPKTNTDDKVLSGKGYQRRAVISPIYADFDGDDTDYSSTTVCVPLVSLPVYRTLIKHINTVISVGGDLSRVVNYLRTIRYKVIGELNTLVVKLKVPTGYIVIVLNIIKNTNIKLVGAIDRLSNDYCIDFCTSMKLYGNTLLISSECKPVNQVQVFKLYGEVESIKLLATEELKHKFKTVRNVLPNIDNELTYLADNANMGHVGNYYDCTVAKGQSVTRIIKELKSKSRYGIGDDIVEELTNLLTKPTKDVPHLPSVTPNLPVDMVNKLTGLLPSGCTLERSKIIYDKSDVYDYIKGYQELDNRKCIFCQGQLAVMTMDNITNVFNRNSEGFSTYLIRIDSSGNAIGYMDISYDVLNRVYVTKYHDVLTGKDTRIVYEYIYVDNILFVLESQDGTSISGISTIVEYH